MWIIDIFSSAVPIPRKLFAYLVPWRKQTSLLIRTGIGQDLKLAVGNRSIRLPAIFSRFKGTRKYTIFSSVILNISCS